MKKHVVAASFIIGFGLLAFVFLVVAMTSLAFLVGGGVSIAWSILGFLGAGALVYWLLTKHGVPRPWIGAAVYVAVLLGSVGVAAVTLDYSWDGNSYHKSAIGLLADGWNPVRQDVNTFNASDQNPFTLIGKEGTDRSKDVLWLNHYPKGSWIFAANMYKITGSIEAGKALAPIISTAVLCIAFGYVAQKLRRNQALVLSALLAFAPIAVAQFTSYYNDGIMGGLLILLFLAGTMLIDTKTKVPMRQWVLYGIIFMAAVLVMNLKFTGLAYAGLILACYWLYFVVTRQWQTVLRFAIVGVALLAVGLLVVGAPSYARNTLTNGHPLYPLMGKGAVDFINIEEPVGYEHMSNLERFVKANLTATAQVNHDASMQQGPPRPKVPFTASVDEIRTLKDVDVRQGGYGVWFGGILLLAGAAGVYALARYGKQYKRALPLVLLPLAGIGLCVVLVDATWWARYMPHLIVFPVIVAGVLYMLRHTVLANMLVFTMLFNTALIALVGLDTQVKFQQTTRQSFIHNVQCGGEPVQVYSSTRLDGSLYNVRDYCKNIHVLTIQEFSDAPKEKTVELYNGIYVIKD